MNADVLKRLKDTFQEMARKYPDLVVFQDQGTVYTASVAAREVVNETAAGRKVIGGVEALITKKAEKLANAARKPGCFASLLSDTEIRESAQQAATNFVLEAIYTTPKF